MGEGMAGIGMMMIILAIVGLFVEDVGTGLLILIPVGVILVILGMITMINDQERHSQDYGRVAQCPRCGSTRVYAMTFDDKRASINFWGIASSKIGKRYHCDSCEYEW